jgi:hypothetical protein
VTVTGDTFKDDRSRASSGNVVAFVIAFLPTPIHYHLDKFYLIRRHGLYASRTKGRFNEIPRVADRAPEGWKAAHQRCGVAGDLGHESLSDGGEEVKVDARKHAWARPLAKVYEVDRFVCPKFGAEMKVRAVIEDPDKLGHILWQWEATDERCGRAVWYSPNTADT